MNQKTEQNDSIILNLTQFYHTIQSHTAHLFLVNVLLYLKNRNIISENENNEQYEKNFTNKKAQIKNKNEIENENKTKNENKTENENENEIENENDNKNFEIFFTDISKLDKNKNRAKEIDFKTKNKQFATTIIHKSKAEFEQKSKTEFEQKSKTKQTDSFTIKLIKKVILKNLNVK